MEANAATTKQGRDAHQHDCKTKTAVTAATVRRLGAHTGTHKSTNQSIASAQRKSNDNFLSALCVNAIKLYNNTGGMN